MTSADTRRWKELFGKLCAMHGKDWDDAQSRFYFDALKSCDFADVQATCEELMRSSKWFPKPAEWRAAIGTRRFNARRERERELAQQRLTPHIHCEECRDTGMRVVRTEPDERLGPCPCRDENPNYQIARARDRMANPDEPSTGISDAEARRITGAVKDFKQLGSGE